MRDAIEHEEGVLTGGQPVSGVVAQVEETRPMELLAAMVEESAQVLRVAC